MKTEWTEDQPIYRQLKHKVVDLILKGVYEEGNAVPSVRQVSSDLSINHLTVSKAYQELVDEGILMKKRGLGMFVIDGAKTKILEVEKEKFINTELPAFITRMEQLGISRDDIASLIYGNKEK